MRNASSLGLRVASRYSALAACLATIWACSEVAQPGSSESVVSSNQALTTSYSVSFQDGTNGYSGTTDSYLSQNRSTTNFASSTTLYVDGDDPAGTGRDLAALLRWNVSSIPANATVTAASLTIYVTNSSATGYPIYGLNRNFTESSSTWSLAGTGTSWATSGAMGTADRDSTSLGIITGTTTGSLTVALNGSGVAEVQSWVNDSSTNFGIVIASSAITDGLDFRSSEYGTVAYRPKLSVSYAVTTADPGAGGTTGAGGSSSTGGMPSTGGSSSTGGMPATGGHNGTGGSSSTAFGFFVFSDMHVTSSSGLFATALSQMAAIDPAPIAGIGTGDFTDSATSAQWNYNTQLASSLFDRTATAFGGKPRYLGAPGNHDILSSNWYSLWNSSMPGQASLGHSGTDGIYFTTTHRNAFFAVMDSNMTSGATTSWSDAQTADLASALASATAQFKFLFFHKPVYSCNSTHSGDAPALPWMDLAEKYNVDAVFSGHTHVYTRRCRTKQATCTSDGTGTIQVEVGTVGSSGGRPINISSATVSGTDSVGAARSDTYSCTAGVLASRGSTNDFCYVNINGCAATIRCYVVSAGNTTAFDTWTIDHC